MFAGLNHGKKTQFHTTCTRCTWRKSWHVREMGSHFVGVLYTSKYPYLFFFNKILKDKKILFGFFWGEKKRCTWPDSNPTINLFLIIFVENCISSQKYCTNVFSNAYSLISLWNYSNNTLLLTWNMTHFIIDGLKRVSFLQIENIYLNSLSYSEHDTLLRVAYIWAPYGC